MKVTPRAPIVVDRARDPQRVESGAPVNAGAATREAGFDGTHAGGGDVVPHGAKGTAKGASPLAVLSRSKAMASTKAWDPIGRLPPELQARLSPGDRRAITEAVGALQKQVRAAKLDHVPVFGYLSLRTVNFAELGKTSQDEVVRGRDIVAATLPDHDVGVLVSTMFRGTPEHPGAVAGLSARAGASTPGDVLKLPLDRAEELLAVVLAREMFAEGDLVDGVDADGKPVSNALYAPQVLPVELEDGARVPALVFTTNEKGDKAIASRPAPFGDGGLTVERLAYLFAAQGGFVDRRGKAHGGPAVDYWEQCYLKAREAAGQPVDPKIAAAVELSKLRPHDDVVDRLLARTDPDAKLMVAALHTLFSGVVTPLAPKQHQKPDLDGLVRVPQGDRGDVEARLLAKAKELAKAGALSE